MTGRRSIFASVKFLFAVFLILFSVLSPCNAKISDKRLCYDKACSVVISKGKTVIPYNSKDHDVLSFPINVDVKIYSKQAGIRQDLWGVEIEGKRGYAPSQFIRELKILHTKLEYIVPTKESDEQINNVVEKIEALHESDQENFSSSEQDDLNKVVLSEDTLKINLEEAIVPHQISPSYESVYDGTLLPQENEESPTPSYSTQSFQNSIKEDEQVRLNMYPNIISSSFPILSDIWNVMEEDSEQKDIEDASLDKNVDDEINNKIIDEINDEKVLEIEKTDKSSLDSKEKQDVLSENVVLDYIEGISKDKILLQELNENNNNRNDTLVQHEASEIDSMVEDEVIKNDSLVQDEVNETDLLVQVEVNEDDSLVQDKVNKTDSLVQDEVNETDSLIQNEAIETDSLVQDEVNEIDSLVQNEENETDSLVQDEVNETDSLVQDEVNEIDSLVQDEVNETDSLVQDEVNETDSLVQDEVNEIDLVIQDEVNETIDESLFSIKNNIIEDAKKIENQEVNINSEAKLENNVEALDVIDSVNNEENLIQSLPLKNVNNDGSSIVEKIKSILVDLQNDIVPKQDETIAVTNNSISSENHTTATVNNEKLKLNEEEVVNTTSIDSLNVKDSTISDVPLKQDVDEESVASTDELSLSEELFQIFYSKNETKEKEDIVDVSDNLTTHESVIRELHLVDNLINSGKQLEVNDNIIDSNNNITDTNTYSLNESTNVHNNSTVENMDSSFELINSDHEGIVDVPSTSSFGEFLGNRNLLNAKKDSEDIQLDRVLIDESMETTTFSEIDENYSSEVKKEEENVSFEEKASASSIEKIVLPEGTCDKNDGCSNDDTKHQYKADENAVTSAREVVGSSDILLCVCITAVTSLLFSLGYYLIENKRRDAYLIGKINNLEKELMVAKKECIMLDENFKSTKAKLDSIEDESFGSNEMVLSLKTELASAENIRAELEDQIVSLEKELESTSEAGLELECMLREILSSHNEENNPLAQSIEDLQVRLNDQQVANESLTNTLATKTRENEKLVEDLKVSLKKVDESQAEVSKLTDELKTQISKKINLEQTLSEQVQKLEFQIKSMTEDKSHLRKKLRIKELEAKELMEVIENFNANNLDFEKLYEFSKIKAEAAHVIEERDNLKIKLFEEEDAHRLLQKHVKVISDEVDFLNEQCKVFEKEKKDAETRLEVLTKFFEEKETQRQKEEAIWLQKQGEVSSTVDRLQTMQNEILNYKQQIEMLKREILDQEREYKNQISLLETKAHEQWVLARQNERRLEEVKAESSQLRNRLTLVEKNLNDGDSEVKLHRMQTVNGETHPLFAAPESSSSPLMFGASGPAPPPPPPGSFLYGPASFAPPPPFLPPPLLAGSRPPPLGGGRLSSPPPGNSGAANNSSNNPGSDAGGNPSGALPLSPPPPLLSFAHHPLHRHRSPPPLPPFTSDVPPPPPPPGPLMHPHHHLHRHMPPPLPPPLHTHQQESHQQQYPGNLHHSWSDEAPLPIRNSSGFHPQQRDQRAGRNHKGSLHSSGESLDKSHHGGKV